MKRCPPDLWVAEIDRVDLDPAFVEPLEIVDQLIEQLQRSEVFICILAGERKGQKQTGTLISVKDHVSLVSYFEIEVFQAALHRVPAVFLARQDFDPGPDLEEFLRILSGSAIVTRWIKNLDDKQIRSEVRSAIENRHILRKSATDRVRSSASDLTAELLKRRSHLHDVRPGGSDMLWLQGRTMRPRSNGRDLSEAERLLAEASKETRHNHRLSRLYMVLRELMNHPYHESSDSRVLELWNTTFDMWWGSAAWYGLHNHLSMGVIAALWSQREIRQRLLSVETHKDRRGFAPPYGALSSAYFSLAKLLQTPRLRWQVSGVGLFLANKTIELGAEHDPTIYGMRGSLHFFRLNPVRGMMDFRHLLSLARAQPENLSLNAEANTYIGRGYSLLRLTPLASRHLREAIRLWRKKVEVTGEGTEFLIKALKHLLELQIRVRSREALETASEALTLARTNSVTDQARQIKAMLANASLQTSATEDSF